MINVDLIKRIENDVDRGIEIGLQLSKCTLVELKLILKNNGIKGYSGKKKGVLIEWILKDDILGLKNVQTEMKLEIVTQEDENNIQQQEEQEEQECGIVVREEDELITYRDFKEIMQFILHHKRYGLVSVYNEQKRLPEYKVERVFSLLTARDTFEHIFKDEELEFNGDAYKELFTKMNYMAEKTNSEILKNIVNFGFKFISDNIEFHKKCNEGYNPF